MDIERIAIKSIENIERVLSTSEVTVFMVFMLSMAKKIAALYG